MEVIATVNINLGLGSSNPSLKITKETDIPSMIKKFVKEFKLPSETQQIIWSKITAQLEKEKVYLSPVPQKQNIKPRKSTISEHKRSVSPIRQRSISSIGQRNSIKTKQILLKKTPIRTKNKENINQQNRSRSPLRVRKNTVEKEDKEKKNIQKLNKLFSILMSYHPKTVKVLSPEFISFNGIDKMTLSALRQFFQQLSEEEYQNMDIVLFKIKMKQLNFIERVCKTFD